MFFVLTELSPIHKLIVYFFVQIMCQHENIKYFNDFIQTTSLDNCMLLNWSNTMKQCFIFTQLWF